MATKVEEIKNTYPMTAYRFLVTVGGDKMAFNSVSGLEQSVEVIEYKDGTGGLFQMPGQTASMNITLKRGLLQKQSQLYQWINSISANLVEKKDISISLTDSSGNTPYITWNVVNAFPTKLSAPSFDATSNDVAFEEMSLRADRMSVEYH
ncbi:phage tail protein [Rouxiella sp. WC2420]|uniref:Phage tail protein n=1 Tax=Rouxiella sp. WC2420 TaxID=3234145 RepID=A0AB39VXP4_9GAMM